MIDDDTSIPITATKITACTNEPECGKVKNTVCVKKSDPNSCHISGFYDGTFTEYMHTEDGLLHPELANNTNITCPTTEPCDVCIPVWEHVASGTCHISSQEKVTRYSNEPCNSNGVAQIGDTINLDFSFIKAKAAEQNYQLRNTSWLFDQDIGNKIRNNCQGKSSSDHKMAQKTYIRVLHSIEYSGTLTRTGRFFSQGKCNTETCIAPILCNKYRTFTNFTSFFNSGRDTQIIIQLNGNCIITISKEETQSIFENVFKYNNSPNAYESPYNSHYNFFTISANGIVYSYSDIYDTNVENESSCLVHEFSNTNKSKLNKFIMTGGICT